MLHLLVDSACFRIKYPNIGIAGTKPRCYFCIADGGFTQSLESIAMIQKR